MSQVEERKKRVFVDPTLQRAVDFKLFELCALLIGPEIDVDMCAEAQRWIQPRHLDDIIEERSNSDLCANIFCPNSLSEAMAKKPKSSRVSPRSAQSSEPRFRIEYGTKRVFEINEHALKFCCVECLEQSERYRLSLDTSLPYSRPCAQSLLSKSDNSATTSQSTSSSSSYANKDVDDILNLLSRSQGVYDSPEIDALSSAVRESRLTEDELLTPAPLYANPHVNEFGAFSAEAITTVAENPIVQKTALRTENDSQTQRKVLRFASSRDVSDANGSEMDENEDSPMIDRPSSAAEKVSSTLRPVYMPATSSQSVSSTKPMMTAPPSTDKEHSMPSNVVDILKGMQDLQRKYDVTSGPPSKSTAFFNSKPLFTPKPLTSVTASTSITAPVSKDLNLFDVSMLDELSTATLVYRTAAASPDASPAGSPAKISLPATAITRDRNDESTAMPPLPPTEDELLQRMQVTAENTVAKSKKISFRSGHVKKWTLAESPPAPHVLQQPVTHPTDYDINQSKSSTSAQDSSPQLSSTSANVTQHAVFVPSTSTAQASASAGIVVSTVPTAATMPPKGILKATSDSEQQQQQQQQPARKGYKPIPKVQPLLAFKISEKIDAAPLSAAALLSKREPTAIEGYVPGEYEELEHY